MDNNLSSHTKKYNTDDVIFLEYEKGDKFYLVQSGSVKITKVIKDVEKLLDIVYAGEFFGEMAILEDTTRSASAIANEPTVLLELRKENFQSILANNTVMALKLSKTFAKRIFDAKRRLLILQLNETDLRVYDCLYEILPCLVQRCFGTQYVELCCVKIPFCHLILGSAGFEFLQRDCFLSVQFLVP